MVKKNQVPAGSTACLRLIDWLVDFPSRVAAFIRLSHSRCVGRLEDTGKSVLSSVEMGRLALLMPTYYKLRLGSAQLAKRLPCKHKDPSSILSTFVKS